MSYSFLEDDRFLISGRSDDYRAFLISRGPGGSYSHSFATTVKRLAVRLRRIFGPSANATGGFFARWATAIGDSKLRRVQRELALQGVHYNYAETSKPAGLK